MIVKLLFFVNKKMAGCPRGRGVSEQDQGGYGHIQKYVFIIAMIRISKAKIAKLLLDSPY